jgi:hypothetical protein
MMQKGNLSSGADSVAASGRNCKGLIKKNINHITRKGAIHLP